MYEYTGISGVSWNDMVLVLLKIIVVAVGPLAGSVVWYDGLLEKGSTGELVKIWYSHNTLYYYMYIQRHTVQ